MMVLKDALISWNELSQSSAAEGKSLKDLLRTDEFKALFKDKLKKKPRAEQDKLNSAFDTFKADPDKNAHAENLLEAIGLKHMLQNDHEFSSPEDAKDNSMAQILEQPMGDLKQRRDNMRKLQAAQITAHLLQERGLYEVTTSVSFDRNGKIDVSLKSNDNLGRSRGF